MLHLFCLLLLYGAQLFASGQCGCLDYDLTQGDDYEAIYNALSLDPVIGDESVDTKRKVVALICSSTSNDGDHLTVRSPLICSAIQWQCLLSMIDGFVVRAVAFDLGICPRVFRAPTAVKSCVWPRVLLSDLRYGDDVNPITG